MTAQLPVDGGQAVQIQAGPQRPVGTIFLNAGKPPFAAVINGGRSGHGKQQGVYIFQMLRIPQDAGQPVDVVVIHKVIGVDVFIDSSVAELAVQGIGDLKIVFIVVGGIDSLVAFIVCDGIQHLRIGPAVIVTVNNLAHQPKIRLLLLAEASEPPEEIRIHAVRSVKPQAVDAEILNPRAYRSQQVIHHLRVLQVQLH